MEQKYAAAGIEPPVEELLSDRIAELIMRRDGIALADVWRVVHAARARLAGGPGAKEPSARDPGLELSPDSRPASASSSRTHP